MLESPRHREYRALWESDLKSASGHSSGRTDSTSPLVLDTRDNELIGTWEVSRMLDLSLSARYGD
jgi:hypothetical protein